jgi:hypothetical protein
METWTPPGRRDRYSMRYWRESRLARASKRAERSSAVAVLYVPPVSSDSVCRAEKFVSAPLSPTEYTVAPAALAAPTAAARSLLPPLSTPSVNRTILCCAGPEKRVVAVTTPS